MNKKILVFWVASGKNKSPEKNAKWTKKFPLVKIS
jgi:hypothetical protein